MQKRAQVWAEKDIKELVKRFKKNLKSQNKIPRFQIDMGYHLHTKKIRF